MPDKRLWILTLLLVCCLGLASTSASAQITTGNLLTDPGFESTAVWKNVASAEDDSASFNVAPAWNGWVTTTPRTQSWQNLIPNGFPHSSRYSGDPFVHGGNRSQNVGRGFATFTAGIYQTVAVTEGANVVGSAWVIMDIPAGANSQARVGIDPNGGNTPFDSDIVWSPWVTNQIGQYRQATVNATATGSSVTLWLYMTQSAPTDPNGVFWDDASLSVGGAGGSVTPGAGTAVPTPAPTAPPVAAFVSPQGARDDGSIVHIVQSGDTLDAIAFAYGITRDQLIELNPDMPSLRFLQIGQEIVVRGPTGSAAPTEESDDAEDEEPAETEEGDEEPTESGNQSASEPTDEPDDAEGEGEDEATATTAPTNTPEPTRTPAPTAPVAVADANNPSNVDATTASVCVMLFNDANTNRIQETGEDPLGGGTISLSQGGVIIDTYATDGVSDPFCFDELAPGAYVAAAQAPTGYGLVSPDQRSLTVAAGDALEIKFAAAEGVEAVDPPEADAGDLTQAVVDVEEPEEDDNDDLLQLVGIGMFGLAGLTLLGGIGAALLLRRR